jgi:competence protein ComEC
MVAAATIGAQIAVAPLLLGTFGQLSLVSPAANLLAEVAVAPATILGLAGGCVGALDPALGGVLARVASPFVTWVLWVGRTFGSPPWAAIEVPHWTGAAVGVVVIGAAVRIMFASGDT